MSLVSPLKKLQKGKTCVILQPTFLPWLGWFDIADQGDIVVLLDDVAFSKQSWQQRNRIRTINGLEYLTVPVKSSGRFGQRISDCELDNHFFVNKMIRTLNASYGKSPWFAELIEEVADIMNKAVKTNLLVELNCALIFWLAKRLNVDTPMIRASALNVGGQRGEHVAAICECLHSNSYLSPRGAQEYLIQDKQEFDSRNISIWIHQFEHPEYMQRFSPFIPYGSSLDLIFNAGQDSSLIMRRGRRNPYAIGDTHI